MKRTTSTHPARTGADWRPATSPGEMKGQDS